MSKFQYRAVEINGAKFTFDEDHLNIAEFPENGIDLTQEERGELVWMLTGSMRRAPRAGTDRAGGRPAKAKALEPTEVPA